MDLGRACQLALDTPLAHGALTFGASVMLTRAGLLKAPSLELAVCVACVSMFSRSVTHVGDGVQHVGDGVLRVGDGVAALASSLDGVGARVRDAGAR